MSATPSANSGVPPTDAESPPDPLLIARAADLLSHGGVVAFPTETVYGLGADARNDRAVERVFHIKGRPADHPLIVHLASPGEMADWARHIPETAWRLVRAFWPGPLTLVLARQAGVSDRVTGGQDSVALRVPAHPVAQALLAAAGPLVAPSANPFGRLSPTTAEHVRQGLGERVDMVLDGGPCPVGVESTIVSLLGDAPMLLRPGGLSADRIEAVLGRPLAGPGGVSTPRVPGLLAAHYAPSTPLLLEAAGDVWQRAVALALAGHPVEVLALTQPPADLALPSGLGWQVMPSEADAYARILYATLHRLDGVGAAVLVVESPPATTAWLAVRDRLARAAATREVVAPPGHSPGP